MTSSSDSARREPMIRLDQLTKRYPGQETPAVDSFDLDVPEGEIVILVGPSGCGKTTTLEMINRLIEPTSGRIFLEGEDVTHVNADHLRRRMGYVIQQIGLFPHQTIAQNVATVPRMLDWDSRQIDERVDELLELVGLDPATYRDRYPKEMSGGQRQRVGVARAMAADPPVMLMDEPFGATDPITRERLQNEFLRIQEDIRKTIVFVTHDIDEAIKMGDRIAILREGSRIAQYDTPETILSDPANEFVEEFLGSGILLKRLNLTRIDETGVAVDEWPTIGADTTTQQARERLRDAGQAHLLLLDDRRRPERWVSAHDLDQHRDLRTTGTPVQATVDERASLNEALQEMLLSANGVAVVVDRDGAYAGTVDLEAITAAIRDMRAAALEADGATAPEGT
ncbi:MAG TPA: betaine/proline/choline family ABC transporter ATP-binding protein [Euzebyales bacterium]|nr:betaine/proline/choline family ABC transporter ATP-binding protein [Euzebyales bacterium]